MKTWHKLIRGGCLEVLKRIEPGSIDLVILDPPYNVPKTTIKFKWRKYISSDFGQWDYFSSENEWIEFTKTWLELAARGLKEGGNILTFSKLDDVGDIRRIYQNNGVCRKATIIWHKTNPAPHIRKTNFRSACEAISWGVKENKKSGKRYTFNFKAQNEMHNFIETPLCMGKERTAHPTQKPERLIAHLVEIFSNPGDVILDPFAGSGTTAVVAIKLGRNSINVEKEREYFKIMMERVELLKKTILNFSVEIEEGSDG